MCFTYNTAAKLNMIPQPSGFRDVARVDTKKTLKDVFKYFLCWVVSSLNVAFQRDC